MDVIKIYAEKNKTLEKEVKKLQSELKTTTELLANVEKYWTQQAVSGDNNKKPANFQNIQIPAENADPTQSSYAVQLLRQNEKLKEKLNQLESQAPVCFHGNCVPPNAPPGLFNNFREINFLFTYYRHIDCTPMDFIMPGSSERYLLLLYFSFRYILMYEEFVLNWLFAFTYRPLLPLHLASSKSNDQKDKLACLKVLTTSAWYVYTIFICK